ncbi:hypothetical protein Ancab_034908 [Ancistrocladus abbreviatus]
MREAEWLQVNPTNTTSIPTTTTIEAHWRWNSPIPYLFGGLALIIGLIVMALLILACSYRKQRCLSSTHHNLQEIPVKLVNRDFDASPRLVVVMAGDDEPTYLATPVSSNGLQV